MARHAVILVPGFFGFGAFGSAGTRCIEYFARVKEALAKALLPDVPVTVFTHEPPAPTGHLDRRAAALFRQIVDLAPAASRFHLVGHSTGGVDVRHVANPGYAIEGASAAERSAIIQRIDSVVTISAPFHGTPIARHLRGADRELLLPIFLLSILTSRDELRLGGRLAMAWLALRKLAFGRSAGRDGTLPRFLLGVDDATADQIRRFLGEIVEDTGALSDLAPANMQAADAALVATDHPALASFVSVGPAPRLSPFRGLHLLNAPSRRALYAVAHHLTTPSADDALPPFPTGAWLDRAPPTNLERRGANDGVVAAAAQTVGGRAAGIVYGDHLDVVGHFDAKGGDATVFKSGAGFDEERFRRLWSAVASVIRSGASRSPARVATDVA